MTQNTEENEETWITLAAHTRDVVAWLRIKKLSDEESPKEVASEKSKAPDDALATHPALGESVVRSK